METVEKVSLLLASNRFSTLTGNLLTLNMQIFRLEIFCQESGRSF